MSCRTPSVAHSLTRVARFATVLLVLGSVAPASAQSDSTRWERMWRGDYDGPRRLEFALAGGYAVSTDWTDRVALQVHDAQGGVHRQVLMRNVAVAPGAGAAASVTYWRGRYGFRVSAAYTESCLTTGSGCDDVADNDDAAVGVRAVPIDVWQYGVEGVVSLPWRQAQWVRPYLLVGAGGVTYDPSADALPIVPGSFDTVVPPSGDGVVVTDGSTMLLVSTSELGLEHVFGITIGGGVDLRVPIGIGGVGVRVELADRITSSPFSVHVARLDSDGRRFGRDDVVFRRHAIHNLRLTAGVMLEIGLPGPRTEHDPWDTRW